MRTLTVASPDAVRQGPPSRAREHITIFGARTGRSPYDRYLCGSHCFIPFCLASRGPAGGQHDAADRKPV